MYICIYMRFRHQDQDRALLRLLYQACRLPHSIKIRTVLCSVLSLDVSKYHHHHHHHQPHHDMQRIVSCVVLGLAWLGLAWLGGSLLLYLDSVSVLRYTTRVEDIPLLERKGRPWGGKIGRCMPGLPNTAWAGLGGAGLGGAWLTGTG